jgi:hypothetical protein
VNFLFAVITGSLVGVSAANAFKIPRLFYTNLFEDGRITARTSALLVLYMSLLALAAGINIVLGRLEIGGGGMNPVGVSSSFSTSIGVTFTVLGALLALGSSIFAAYTDAEGGMSVKYVWLVNIVPNLLMWIYDYVLYSATSPRIWTPAVCYLGSLVIAMFLFWLVVNYIPAPREGMLLDEKLYRNVRRYYSHSFNCNLRLYELLQPGKRLHNQQQPRPNVHKQGYRTVRDPQLVRSAIT